jgi:hypothetical protein
MPFHVGGSFYSPVVFSAVAASSLKPLGTLKLHQHPLPWSILLDVKPDQKLHPVACLTRLLPDFIGTVTPRQKTVALTRVLSHCQLPPVPLTISPAHQLIIPPFFPERVNVV